MFERIEKIRSILSLGEGALISSDANRFYLSGFETSAGYIAVAADGAVLFVDSRYFEKAKKTVKSCEVRLATDFLKQISEYFSENSVKKLYIETDHITVGALSVLRERLNGLDVSEDEKLSKKLLRLRAVKSKNELESIRQAQLLTEQTFSYILERIETGRSEREVMLDMEFFMRRLGSEGVAFDFIVVSGKNSSLPHGVPTDKKIEKGDFVTMDFGAVVDGYRSDMTRTVAIGYVTDEQKAVYDTVLCAQAEALKSIKAGKACCDIDKIARDIIYGAGYEGFFGHALGHSVGVEIHETPNFSPRSKDTLLAGNIMTVEPGIYIPDKFGVRIEDMVFVTEKGCENLTKSPKNLIIL